MEHMQARHLLKQYHRARLGHIGLGFCDENATRLQKLEQQYADARGSWETESTLYRPVIVAAWHASTTDNELQTIGTTLRNDRLFWSSTGSPTQIADEALLYELEGPACQAHFVRMAVYRAFYQHGYPVYPPMQLQVWSGPSPSQLQPASQVYDVQATDALQTFALTLNAPVARFLQIRMYGKLQKQREDMQFCVAIRHVSVVGCIVPSSQLLNLRPVLRSGVAMLNPGGQLPGSCCAGLANVTHWGLGPGDAAFGAVAAGKVLTLPGMQQQEPGKVESDKTSSAADQLLVRQQQQQGSNRSSKRPHQQVFTQQQQRPDSSQAGSSDHVSSRFWSSLGSGLSKWRSRHQHSDATADSTLQMDADAVQVCPSSPEAPPGVPKWLLPDAAECSGEGQQQQHNARSQITEPAEAVGVTSRPRSSSASEEGYNADDDTDDHMQRENGPADGAATGWAAVHDLAGAAEQARMELLLWQALNRLPNPDDPVGREQLLAAWLEDEPLHSNIPAAFRQQQLAPSTGSLPGGQLLPGGWELRPRPVVRRSQLGSRSNNLQSSKAGFGSLDPLQGECKGGGSSVALGDDLGPSCTVHISGELVVPAAVVMKARHLAPAAAETAAVALARGMHELDDAPQAEPRVQMRHHAEAGPEITADLLEQQQQAPAVCAKVSASDLFSAASLSSYSSSNHSQCQDSFTWMDEGVAQDWFSQQQVAVA